MSTSSSQHYRYTIDLSEAGYAELMRLVMRYGTGAGDGIATTAEMRLDLASPEIRGEAVRQTEDGTI